MVQTIINVDDHTNCVLNVIEVEYCLRDKSLATDKVVEEYVAQIMNHALRPENVEKVKDTLKQKARNGGTTDDLWKDLDVWPCTH